MVGTEAARLLLHPMLAPLQSLKTLWLRLSSP
jgi:hypothetical protein